MTLEIKLQPCPTCGKSDSVEIHQTNYPGERFAVCNFNDGGCGTRTAGADNAVKAAANWNRRAALPAPISSNITNATVTGGAVDGNQVFVSMDRQPPIALRTLGARAHIAYGYRASLSAEPVPCATCGGEGVVDDGVLTHSDGGIEYDWPINCVKDCPTCKAAPPAPVSVEDVDATGLPEWKRLGYKSEIDHLHVQLNVAKACIKAHEQVAAQTAAPLSDAKDARHVPKNVRRSAEFTRADLGQAGSNYPHVRILLAYVEAAIGAAKDA